MQKQNFKNSASDVLAEFERQHHLSAKERWLIIAVLALIPDGENVASKKYRLSLQDLSDLGVKQDIQYTDILNQLSALFERYVCVTGPRHGMKFRWITFMSADDVDCVELKFGDSVLPFLQTIKQSLKKNVVDVDGNAHRNWLADFDAAWEIEIEKIRKNYFEEVRLSMIEYNASVTCANTSG